jgi:class 3 adenylate cyclase
VAQAAARRMVEAGSGAPGGVIVNMSSQMGHVGSERRLEFTLIGVPVNNSSYLSKVRPAKVLMSETTRDLLPDGFEVTDHEAMLLKGANEPQSIYQLQITVTAEG